MPAFFIYRAHGALLLQTVLNLGVAINAKAAYIA